MTSHLNTSFLMESSFNDEDKNRQDMIVVDHVSMSFNVANQQLNSIKEYAIALMKRQLFYKEFKALDDISLTVKKGDVYGILGTNGSGKSTLLKIIAGVLSPTKGKVEVYGNIAPLIELGAGFDPELTARENVYLNGSLLGYTKKFIDENIDDIIDFAEVNEFADMPLKNFSSGMTARVAFAIATVIVPEILIVDEVLSVGDYLFKKKCEERIRTLIEEHGTTVLVVSHSIDQIRRLCNKCIWIEKSHTRAIGKTQDVCLFYEAVGGHKGSIESEEHIISVLKKPTNEANDKVSLIRGSNIYEICNNHILLDAVKDKSSAIECVVVLSGEANTASLRFLALNLAKATNGICVYTETNELSASAGLILNVLSPSRIIVLGCDGRRIENKVINEIKSTTDQNIDFIEMQPKTHADLSFMIDDFINTNCNITSSLAFITDYKGANTSALFSQLIDSQATHIFFFPIDEDVNDEFVGNLKNLHVNEIVATGEHAQISDYPNEQNLLQDFTMWNFSEPKDIVEFDQINQFIRNKLQDKEICSSKKIVICAYTSITNVYSLISMIDDQIEIIPVDTSDLDNVSSVLKYIEQHAKDISNVYLINAGLNHADIQIFTNAIS